MKFPVWPTSLDVFKFLWRERQAAVRFSSLPLAISLLLTAALQMIFGTAAMTAEGAAAGAAPLFILMLVQLVLYLPVTITWYRLVVAGQEEAQRRPLFTLGRVEWRYLLWQLTVILIVFGFLAMSGLATYVLVSLSKDHPVMGLVASIAGVASLIATFLLMTRLSMVSVLVSLDKPASLKMSWRMTTGTSWRLLGATALVMLGVILLSMPLGIVVGIVMAIVSMMGAEGISAFFDIATQNIVSFAGILAIATLFGFVYKMLTAQTAGAPDHIAQQAPRAGTKTTMLFKAQVINAIVWASLWLGWGPYDDLPRMLGRGMPLLVMWLLIHLVLRSVFKKKPQTDATAPEAGPTP